MEAAHKRIAEGWQFIALGSELKFMVTEAQKAVEGMGLKNAGDLARY
jgi:4-hydroxy-2-oxoheptanedioate aldolase